jgi:hypothetical protein
LVLVEDKRSKKVVIVAHCFLNQNAKVECFTLFPAKAANGFLHNKFGILQLSCDEAAFSGDKQVILRQGTVLDTGLPCEKVRLKDRRRLSSTPPMSCISDRFSLV